MDAHAPISDIDIIIEKLKSEFLLQEYQQINEILDAHFDQSDYATSGGDQDS